MPRFRTKDRLPLRGRHVAITGGARGIGRATAEAVLREGGQVAIGDVDAAAVEQAVDELGDSARGYRLDVTDVESFRSFLGDAERDLGPCDVLINNAGIMCLSPFAREEFDSIRRQLEVNVFGVLTGTRLAVERMLPRGAGHVVNVASFVGKVGLPGGGTYCATKHAVVGLTEAVSAELRGTGVAATVVLPAIVSTELASGLKPPRFVGVPTAEHVAAAMVRAIQRRPVEVFVPRRAGHAYYAAASLPRAARTLVARAFRADTALIDYDPAARAAYEARARGADAAETHQTSV